MNISVIIPTKNRAGVLSRCLTSLLIQLHRDDEVIVVDSGSDNSTKNLIRSFTHPAIRYIHFHDTSASGARNIGAALTTNAVLAFLDDDSFVQKNWARHIKRTLTEGRGRRIIFQGAITQMYERQGPMEIAHREDYYRDLAKIGIGKRTKRFASVTSLFAGNMFGSRRVFASLHGPFDAARFPFIGEQADLACRAIKLGIALLYDPTVSVVHSKPPVHIGEEIETAYQYGRAQAMLSRLYYTDPDFLLRAASHYPAIEAPGPDTMPKQNGQGKDALSWWYRTLMRTAFRIGYEAHMRLPIADSA